MTWRKSLFAATIFLALNAVSSPANAAHFTAKVAAILLYSDGNLIYVYPEGGVKNAPPCHGSNGDYVSFNMSRPMAKAYLAALLSAQMSGKVVDFVTYGQCLDQSVSDTLAYFRVVS